MRDGGRVLPFHRTGLLESCCPDTDLHACDKEAYSFPHEEYAPQKDGTVSVVEK